MAEEKKPQVGDAAAKSAAVGADETAKPEEQAVAKAAAKPGVDKKAGKKAAGKAVDTAVDKTAAPAELGAATKKKEKPPALEDKPFNEFIEQHYLPSLKAALAKEGIDNLNLEFAKRKIEVMGQNDSAPYWQVQGQWEEATEGRHQFNIAFIDENISGQKVLTLTANGAKSSTIEQFMGDERKITLDLMVLYTLQRLNGQKWLTRN